MFQIIQDIHIGESTFRCANCDGERVFYREDLPPIYCSVCYTLLNPRIGDLLNSKKYRLIYHRSRKENHGEKRKGKVYSGSYSPY